MIVIVYTIMVLFAVGISNVDPALAVSEDGEEQNENNNVMLKIGQMILTGNYTIPTTPTPPFWYQNSSWLDGSP